MLAFFEKCAIIRELNMREWLSGRALPCQGKGREFESRLPLQTKRPLEKEVFLCFWGFEKNFFKNNTKFVDIISKMCYIINIIDGTIAKW